jgi:DNA replication and repair protein RecF
VRVQIDFVPVPSQHGLGGAGEHPSPDAERGASEPPKLQKLVRVNGVPRRASELVGEINAVMFSAQDLDLVSRPPSVRRRYLDILISQVDSRYLRTLQRYQSVVSQRNHLLRSVAGGRAQTDELAFWDDELVASGSHIIARRAETVRLLSDKAGPIHGGLTGDGDRLELTYRPNIAAAGAGSEEEIGQSMREALLEHRPREVAQGFTVSGPHRDDLQIVLDGMDVGLYASRGQCRTVVLAMRLAEAGYLRDMRGQEPILLLDDVLSELDESRRSHILDTAAQYEQCLISTADVGTIGGEHLSRMARFAVDGGRVEPVGRGG